ncbi:MAG: metallophosphoesterase [Crocinitomicaceae bacterium]|nr:metallophosphoesterase [Crocinitomicaceae bacterium]MCF8409841.1 metallophosphoesterase [Crocinitomicaceae bacterium]MCF8444348.1 metallophosphoesterase [Crocinitomicaceae bacterium]
MKFIGVVLLLFSAPFSFGKEKFVRVVFNRIASEEATVIWHQASGDFQRFIYTEGEPKTESTNKMMLVNKVSSTNNARGFKTHIIRLTKLKPNTKYSFNIVDNEGISRLYYFSTCSDSPEDRISFIAGGDSRDRSAIRRKANVLVSKLKAHAVLFNGDFTGLDLPHQWVEWFTDWEFSIASDGRITPLVVTRGNHEHSNSILVKLFDVPSLGVFYSTEFGGNLLNLVSLNSEILKIGVQKIFLASTLKKHEDFKWQIAQYHRPIRSHVKHKKEMETQYRNFVPLFEKYKNLRLCLENDSHTCKVTWPIVSSKEDGSSEGFIRDDEKGIVYAGEGCWGAPLRAADDLKPWTRDAAAVNQFNWIFIAKDKIELRTVLYENADVVMELTEETRFSMPENINLWNPSNGNLVEIFQQKSRNIK